MLSVRRSWVHRCCYCRQLRYSEYLLVLSHRRLFHRWVCRRCRRSIWGW